MGPIAHGSKTTHVSSSKGPDSNIMKFYITEHSSNFGRDGYIPRTGKHTGTGYQSNFRTGVYYNRKMDELDNPEMGRLCEDNYHSMTKKEFQKTIASNGRDPFPGIISGDKTSGFIKDVPRTTPAVREVRQVCIDTRSVAPPGTVFPNSKPLLHLLKKKDPIARENCNYGPGFMSTENHTRFQGQRPHSDTSTKIVGPKESTGFTHAKNREPITYYPEDAHDAQRPSWFTRRPTGISEQKVQFQPSMHSIGKEPFEKIALNAETNSGYTREIKPTGELTSFVRPYTALENVHRTVGEKVKKKDPVEYTNLQHPKQYTSLMPIMYQGQQRYSPSLAQRLGNSTIGQKEKTGFTENNEAYLESPETEDSLWRFNTHYTRYFYDKNHRRDPDAAIFRKGNLPQLDDGFTKSTQVHKEATLDTQDQLRKLNPYVSRSIKAQDTFYDDHTHDHKFRSPITAT